MRPNDSFVSQPVRSLQTMLRVIAKDNNRLPLVVPDGIYGPSTMNTVAAFQRLYGIPITGITNQTTWEEISNAYMQSQINIGKAAPIEVLLEPNQIISKGEQNPYIYLLQGMLANIAQSNSLIPTPGLTGILDTDTSESLIAFQRIAGLNETGDLNRLTWLYLVNYFNLDIHAQGSINFK